jgi:hypothetical protein
VDSSPVVYSTPSAAAVTDFVSTHYDLPNSIECKFLYRGWNDIFEVRTNGGVRLIFAFQSDAHAVTPMLHRKPRFSPIWTGRAFRSLPRFRRGTVLFSPQRFSRKVSVPRSSSIMLKDARLRQEAQLQTQKQTG